MFSALGMIGIQIIMSGVILLSTATVNIVQAAAPTKCEDLATPQNIQGWLTTIIEEPIGSAPGSASSQAASGTIVLNCFRQSSCTISGSTQQCTAANPEYTTTCTASSTTECDPVQVYFSQSGAGLLFTYISQIYKWAAVTIGIVSVLYLTWGGIEISTAQDNAERSAKGKERIMQSLGGLVLLFLSALILYTINPNFFTLS